MIVVAIMTIAVTTAMIPIAAEIARTTILTTVRPVATMIAVTSPMMILVIVMIQAVEMIPEMIATITDRQ
jgi:hypothetical protein